MKRRNPETDPWKRVWKSVRSFFDEFPDDAVAIGGVAIYLHTKAFASRDVPVETTHDADVFLNKVALGDLRQQHEVTANRRLSKREVTIDGVEIDIYVSHQSSLRLDYDEVATEAVEIDSVRVASLVHLLMLKLDAYADRRESDHGRKDRRDIAKLLVMLEHDNDDIEVASDDEGDQDDQARDHLTDDDLKMIDDIMRSRAFLEIAQGNSKQASRLKKRAQVFVDELRAALQESDDE